MTVRPDIDELFERRIVYPDFEPQERLAALVGLDSHKNAPDENPRPAGQSNRTVRLGEEISSGGRQRVAHGPRKATPRGSGRRCRIRQVRSRRNDR